MRRATIRQCAILAGGLGTRLGALAAHTPKPILPCGDRPFLAWLMREFIRFGVTEFLLLTGHLSDQVRAGVAAIAPTLPRRVAIDISEETVPAGTGGALFHARDRLHERFLLCNGDSLLDFNLGVLLADAARDPDATIGRIVLRHADDASRCGVVETAGGRVCAFRERPPAAGATPATINAGIYVFSRKVLDHVTGLCSLERDVMPGLAASGVLQGTEVDGYFVDIGIPEDLERAQRDLPVRLKRPALFLDRDGVMNVDHGYVGSRERFTWLPGAIETARRAAAQGLHVFIVTNQSGVARGHYDEVAVRDLMTWMEEQVRAAGGTIDDWRFCPTHPEGIVPAYRTDSAWRKPGPGMLLDLLRAWEVDAARSLMIGDQDTDLQAAAAAGMRGAKFPGGDLAAFAAPLLAGLR